MTRYAVDYATLGLLTLLMERQAEHLRAITTYLDAHTRLDGMGPLAVVMNALRPRYDEARDTALEGFDQGREVCAAVAERATTTRDLYSAADRACVEGLCAAAAPDLDVSGITYAEPAAPAGLGGPAGTGGGTWTGATFGQVPKWQDPLGDARPAVSAVQTFGDKSSGRIFPGASDPTKPFAIRAPFDAGMKSLTARFWERLDQQYGIPGAASLRDRFEARQMARFGAGYDDGYTRFRNGGIHAGGGEWVRDGMTQRTVQSGALVMSTVAAARGAWNNVAALDVAVDRGGYVGGVADGPDNTDSIDWARQP